MVSVTQNLNWQVNNIQSTNLIYSSLIKGWNNSQGFCLICTSLHQGLWYEIPPTFTDWWLNLDAGCIWLCCHVQQSEPQQSEALLHKPSKSILITWQSIAPFVSLYSILSIYSSVIIGVHFPRATQVQQSSYFQQVQANFNHSSIKSLVLRVIYFLYLFIHKWAWSRQRWKTESWIDTLTLFKNSYLKLWSLQQDYESSVYHVIIT